MTDDADAGPTAGHRDDLPLSTGMDVRREDSGGRRRRIVVGAAVGAVLVGAAVWTWSLDPAGAEVDRSSILVSEVRRGDLVRRVRGTGRLEPEKVQFISAVSGGRVEEIHVRPGERVEAGTVLLKLSNPDVRLRGLRARDRVTAARKALVQLRQRLQEQRLDQEVAVENARTEYRKAAREARADSALAERGLIARNEAKNSRERVDALETGLRTEQQKFRTLKGAVDRQLRIQEEELERLRSVARFHRERREDLTIRTRMSGVVQGLDLEPGQWVQPGTRVAKVARSDSLRAELRVPEGRARSVRAGQHVTLRVLSDSTGGRVLRVEPNVRDGSVRVLVEITGELPEGARVDQSVDGTIRIERLEHVLHVERPPNADAGSAARVFVLDEEEDAATRRRVRFGKASVDRIRVREGLKRGERVIVTDMSRWSGERRIALE